MNQDLKKQRAADAALDYVRDGTVIGVGTGSTVNFFIDGAGAAAASRIAGAVSSSEASTQRLRGPRHPGARPQRQSGELERLRGRRRRGDPRARTSSRAAAARSPARRSSRPPPGASSASWTSRSWWSGSGASRCRSRSSRWRAPTSRGELARLGGQPVLARGLRHRQRQPHPRRPRARHRRPGRRSRPRSTRSPGVVTVGLFAQPARRCTAGRNGRRRRNVDTWRLTPTLLRELRGAARPGRRSRPRRSPASPSSATHSPPTGARPDLVALPGSTAEVRSVLRLAAAHRRAGRRARRRHRSVRRRVAGRGRPAAGALAARPHPRGRSARAASPASSRASPISPISEAAAPHGLFYAPDPSSQVACTIGGNVAENSGGVHCLKYGLTVHNLLEVDGRDLRRRVAHDRIADSARRRASSLLPLAHRLRGHAGRRRRGDGPARAAARARRAAAGRASTTSGVAPMPWGASSPRASCRPASR